MAKMVKFIMCIFLPQWKRILRFQVFHHNYIVPLVYRSYSQIHSHLLSFSWWDLWKVPGLRLCPRMASQAVEHSGDQGVPDHTSHPSVPLPPSPGSGYCVSSLHQCANPLLQISGEGRFCFCLLGLRAISFLGSMLVLLLFFPYS